MISKYQQQVFNRAVSLYTDGMAEKPVKMLGAATDILKAAQLYSLGVLVYVSDFMAPFWTAWQAFNRLERKKIRRTYALQTMADYFELLQFNLQIAEQGMTGTVNGFREFYRKEAAQALMSLLNSIYGDEEGDIGNYAARLANLTDGVINRYPEAIKKIGGEFGFHFDDGGYIKTAETERFLLYQVLSRDKGIRPRMDGKPVIIIHPYVLGPNILSFLPDEKKSYVHAFADQGIPTYIRILKDIQTTEAVQVMTGEDDARDTRYFCELLKATHGRAVTLNGFCQGGFMAVLDILSGELDGLVDALITCVAPMDGTRSKSLVEYMQHLPDRFRDLNYAVKKLPNGNGIVDGKVMSWVYKLKSMEKEAPFVTFYRDLGSIDGTEISKTAAAMNHWLIYDRIDLPEGITKLSFDSYTIPVSADGTLPVKLFGKTLNFKGIEEKGIAWLLCYAERDDLVDRDAALAPTDFIDVEVTPFPKGHGAIATSWSDPRSACALHTRFGKGYRGPVRFQLDLEEGKIKNNGS